MRLCGFGGALAFINLATESYQFPYDLIFSVGQGDLIKAIYIYTFRCFSVPIFTQREGWVLRPLNSYMISNTTIEYLLIPA